MVSMLFQLGAAIYAISLIRRTRFNISWILISAALALMAIRRLFDFSTLFLETKLYQNEEINSWIGVLISVLIFIGVIFIRKIFNLQDRIEQLREENAQNILSAVIKAEDKARQNFARELHDGLGPVLSSIKMTLSAISDESLTPMNKKIIKSAYHATDNSITTLKEISNNLSPHLLTNYGLEKVIETLANQLFSPRNIQYDLKFNMKENLLSEELKFSCYRIVAELMNNSLKHANPSLVNLTLSETDHFLSMLFKDDGSGMEYNQSILKSEFPGMGLNNIFSRAKSLKGNYIIQTSPGNGFSIEFHFPLP